MDDAQNYLRPAFQDVNSGRAGKTLLLRPDVPTEDVCQLCAEKFQGADPEEYGEEELTASQETREASQWCIRRAELGTWPLASTCLCLKSSHLLGDRSVQ